MRLCVIALLVAALAAPAQAGEKPPGKSLKVGDPAPALKADNWLQGSEVKEFSKGKVYVVEFWATWCGPCIVIMPHVGELQAQYREQGVTIIGYSAKDPNNSREKVAEFVKKRGPKLGYTFAYADSRDSYDAWMKAAGQNGIPCCFVVDRAGLISYIGHPLYLDIVLPKVVAGTWGESDVAALKSVEQEINGVFRAVSGPDAAAGLKALDDLEAKHRGMSKLPYFIAPKILMLVKSKMHAEAKKFSEELVAKALKQEDVAILQMVSGALRSPDAKGQKELAALSLKSAEAALKIAGGKDLQALYNLAETHFALGNRARAREIGAQALEVASPQQRGFLEKRIKTYEDEK